MPDREAKLRLKVRTLISEGHLPSEGSGFAWAGFGDGTACCVCEQRIDREEIKYHLEVCMRPYVREYRFHDYCHGIWLLESASRRTDVPETA